MVDEPRRENRQRIVKRRIDSASERLRQKNFDNR
jgi:hypothetical protein